jgi:hypothetical protein
MPSKSKPRMQDCGLSPDLETVRDLGALDKANRHYRVHRGSRTINSSRAKRKTNIRMPTAMAQIQLRFMHPIYMKAIDSVISLLRQIVF